MLQVYGWTIKSFLVFANTALLNVEELGVAIFHKNGQLVLIDLLPGLEVDEGEHALTFGEIYKALVSVNVN